MREMFDVNPAEALAEAMRLIYGLGLTTTSGGNLSIMDENGVLWITPSSIDKGSLTAADIVARYPDGHMEGAHKPSIEMQFHARVYEMRPDIRAIVHAHPPALSAWALRREVPNAALLPDVGALCGLVGMARFEIPGSAALCDAVGAAFAGGERAVLLANHGAMTGAGTLGEAFLAFEALEQLAETALLSRRLGGGNAIGADAGRGAGCGDLEMHAGTGAVHVADKEEMAARAQLCAFAARGCLRRLFTGALGGMSVRFRDGVLATPAGGNRRDLRPEEIVWVDSCGAGEPGKQADGLLWQHRVVYAAHPELGAVITAHPAHLGAYAVSGQAYDNRYLSEGYVIVRRMEQAGACDAAGQVSPERPLVIAQGQGVIVAGERLVQAFDRLEVAECGAAAMILAGDGVLIEESGLAEMQEAYGLGVY